MECPKCKTEMTKGFPVRGQGGILYERTYECPGAKEEKKHNPATLTTVEIQKEHYLQLLQNVDILQRSKFRRRFILTLLILGILTLFYLA